ncbi:MAG: hypothetical protein NTW49_10730 [Bacteroidia bacterium]|nr:hypothetical protein [Bacteroidia bacterium]
MKGMFLYLLILVLPSNTVFSQIPDNNRSQKPGNEIELIASHSNAKSSTVNQVTIKDTIVPSALPEGKPVIDSKPNGSVNWTGQFVEAEGSTIIDTVRFKNKAQAELMAISGAKAVAQRNLLEIVKGVYVVGETRVIDMMTENDYVITRVVGVIKGAVLVGEPRVEKEKITVKMRVPLYQPDGLAPIFKTIVDKTAAEELENVNNSAQVQSSPDNSQVIAGGINPDQMTQLIIDLKGNKPEPGMFPVLTDNEGKVVLDFSKFYDPSTGNFPKYMTLSKDVLNVMGQSKTACYIEALQQSQGKFMLSDALSVEKISKWKKAGKWALTLAKLALLFI